MSASSPPVPLPIHGNATVMFVTAHPDDIEYCAGGTVRRLVEAGAAVHYVVFTNGDKGCSNATLCAGLQRSEDVAAQRVREQQAACAVSGVPFENAHLLDLEGCMLDAYAKHGPARQLIQLIRQIRPDIVITWAPYANFDLPPSAGWDDVGWHPDHQASGAISLYAMRTCGVARAFPELGPARKLSAYYMFEFLEPDVFVDVSSTLENKIDAFGAHASQLAYAGESKELLTALAQRVAKNVAGFTGQFAEGFKAFF